MTTGNKLTRFVLTLVCALALLGVEALHARNFFMQEGTEIALRLRTSVDAESSREGDRVICTVEEPVILDQVEVIPVGARVHGRIASLKKAGRLGRGGELVLSFDALEIPGTGRLPIAGSVVDLYDPDDPEARKQAAHLDLGQEGEIRGDGPGALKRIVPIAGAGGGGAALGGVKGAAIGVIAGTAFSYIFWKGKEVDLPAGTGIVIEIDRSLAFSVPEMPTAVSGDGPRSRR